MVKLSWWSLRSVVVRIVKPCSLVDRQQGSEEHVVSIFRVEWNLRTGRNKQSIGVQVQDALPLKATFGKKISCIKLHDSFYPEPDESDPCTGPFEYYPYICGGFLCSVSVPGSITNILYAECVKTVARLFCGNARHHESLPDSFFYSFLKSSAMLHIFMSCDCIYR